VPVYKVISTFGGICNGFYWNRRWTFGITETTERARQFRRFVAVNVVGATMNIGIVTILMDTVTLAGLVKILFCQAAAAGIVMIWNFAGSRLWAFRKT
jgi:putative flippase GtrA